MKNAEKEAGMDIEDSLSAFVTEIKRELVSLPKEVRDIFINNFRSSGVSLFDKKLTRCSQSAVGASKYVVSLEFGGSALEFIMATVRASGHELDSLTHSDSLSV